VVASVRTPFLTSTGIPQKHSDSIVTRDEGTPESFCVAWIRRRLLERLDALHDGAEFGFGAEMGIRTQKLHCAGPVALAELTSSKYEIVGTGQVRQPSFANW